MKQFQFELANIGGTFAALHEGHKEYIEVAFLLAKRVQIIVNDTGFAQTSRKYAVPPLNTRLQQLNVFLAERQYSERVDISIHPRDYGEFEAWLNPKLDCVVVSDELYANAEKINRERILKKLPSYHIHIKPRVSDVNDNELTSTKLFLNQKHATRL